MNRYDAKEIFSSVRTLCPGLPEDANVFCEDISRLALPSDTSPEDFCRLVGLKEKYAFFYHYKSRYVQQLVDIATDDEFAEEFRTLCRQKFQWLPTARRIWKTPSPDSLATDAANWWVGVLQLDSIAPDPPPGLPFTRHDMLGAFHRELVSQVERVVTNPNRMSVYFISVESWHSAPRKEFCHCNSELSFAFEAAHITHEAAANSLPSQATMYIVGDSIRVCMDHDPDVWIRERPKHQSVSLFE